MCPYNHDSDRDFEDQPKIVRKRKKRASVLANNDDTSELQDESLPVHSEPQGDASDITQTMSPVCLNWEELPADMQSVLPPDEEYTSYVIQSHTVQETEQFARAPAFSFSVLLLE